MKTTQLFAIFLCLLGGALHGADKPRVFLLTDIENELDDAMSMVRLLTYTNHFDIEGLVTTTSVQQQRRVAPQRKVSALGILDGRRNDIVLRSNQQRHN